MADDSDRLEREIEEILSKIEHFPDAETRRTRARKRALRGLGGAIAERQRAVAKALGRISIGQVMLVSFLMILAAFFFRGVGPLSWLLYAGIILFVTSFAIMLFARGSGSGGDTVEQRWRGREIRYSTRGPSLSQRLRRWWASRRTRR
jgi:hypothetical protein